MDIITYALLKKIKGSDSSTPSEKINITIGENGNWYVDGQDTGVSALPPGVDDIDIADLNQDNNTTLYIFGGSATEVLPTEEDQVNG